MTSQRQGMPIESMPTGAIACKRLSTRVSSFMRVRERAGKTAQAIANLKKTSLLLNSQTNSVHQQNI